MGKNTKKIVTTIIILILLVVVLYRMFHGSFQEILMQIKELSIFSILLVIIFSVLYQIFEGIIVAFLLKKHYKNFSMVKGIQTVFQGCFYRGITFGSGTQAGQIYFLAGNGIEPSKSISALTISYAMQKIGVFLYVTVCFFLQYSFYAQHYRDYIVYINIGYFLNIFIVCILILIVVSKKFHALILYFLNKILKKEKHKELLEKINIQISTLSVNSRTIIKDKKLLLKVIVLEFFKLSCWYVIPYILLRDRGLFEIILISAFMNALLGVIPAPTGIMSTELVFTAMFSVAVGFVKAGAAMIIYRFATYIVPFLLGIITWLILKKKHLRQ